MSRFLRFMFHPAAAAAGCLLLGLWVLFGHLLSPDGRLVPAAGTSLLPEDQLLPFTAAELARDSWPAENNDAPYAEPATRSFVTAREFAAAEADFARRARRAGTARSGRYPAFASAQLEVRADRGRYYRFQPIRLLAFAGRALKDVPLYAVLYRGTNVVRDAGGRAVFPFQRRGPLVVASFSPGYDPPAGHYVARVHAVGDMQDRAATVELRIVHRAPRRDGQPLAAMTMETSLAVRRLEIREPFGRRGDFRALFAWADLLTANAFFILGAQTSGRERELSPAEPFTRTTLDNVKLLGPESVKRGLLFGSYVISYYTPYGGTRKAGYAPSIAYGPESGALYESAHTSLASRKRFFDLLWFTRRMQADGDVGAIGYDFIRTGHADGFELVDRFVADASVAVPDGWGRMDKRARMRWLGERYLRAGDRVITPLWRHWRAQAVAGIVGKLLELGRVTKPAWCFTLGWEHGWHHGQDVYMMTDAGVRWDAAMLYEANEAQYRGMQGQWRRYVRGADAPLLMGQMVDARLNDSSRQSVLEECHERFLRGIFRFLQDGAAQGLFWHDVARAAIRGRLAPHAGAEWAIVGADAAGALREAAGTVPFSLDAGGARRHPPARFISVAVRNHAVRALSGVSLRVLPDGPAVRVDLAPGEQRDVRLEVPAAAYAPGGTPRAIAVRADLAGVPPVVKVRFVAR